jgi:hypothetical protein
MSVSTPPTASPGVTPPLAPELWDWYKYHADQRLRSFNFFIVFVGGLVLLLGSSSINSHLVLARIASALGIVLSLGFFMLDVRNAQLVDITFKSIEAREGTLGDVIDRANLATITWKEIRFFSRDRGFLTNVARHKFVLRVIMLAAAVVFAIFTFIGPR